MRWLPAYRPFTAETERYALYTYIILYTCSISVLYSIDAIVYGIYTIMYSYILYEYIINVGASTKLLLLMYTKRYHISLYSLSNIYHAILIHYTYTLLYHIHIL